MAEQDPLRGQYAEYRRRVEGEPLTRSLRIAVLVLFVIQSVFIFVDWLLYPELFAKFLPVRLGLNAVLGAIFFWSSRLYPLASTYATCFAGGAMLLAVVYGTGGPSSGYYVGLVLLLFGLGVLTPVTAGQASIVSVSLLLAYALLPVVSDQRVEWEEFALHLFFLGASGFGGVMSCMVLDRMRFSDFQQRREIEKARDDLSKLDREKSRFTANVHHELRTPLTLTLAPVEAMLVGEFGEISELQRGYLKTIQSNGLRLLKLINNLLDLAKIEGQQLSVVRRPVRLGDLVEEIVSGARPLAERKGVTLALEGLEELPVVHADPEAFEKILVNLLGNALKFTDRGGRITVSGRAAADGGVHFVVADTGAGIPSDQLERIFDRFAQVDASTTRKHEGTGIGLALVRELVELHGGRVWAESEGAGHGSQIHVVLPVGEADAAAEDVLEGDDASTAALGNRIAAMGAELELDEEASMAPRGDALRLVDLEHNVERSEGAAAPPTVPALPEHPPETPEVLVVEDNVDMRRLLAFLVGQEFRVRVARNGREGLEAARVRAPDLVLTDIMMPEMSGTELCAAIKGDAELAAVPVVLVTSKAERQMKIEGLELGADDYVVKPFHPRELLARVRSLVKLHRTQEELAVRNELLESINEELERALEELREASAQLVHAERLAAVGELAAGVAHEVNNPVNFALNAVKALHATVGEVRALVADLAAIDPANSEALHRQVQALRALRDNQTLDATSETLDELTGIVTEGLERTAALVGDLRNFAAPGEREWSRVDIVRGLRTTLRLMGHTFMRARVEVHLDLPEGLPPVEGDARALNQVFLNLLKNAAEALEGQGGSVSVCARQEGEFVAVEICDDGPGVAAAVREQLFQPFFTTKSAGRGTGLGLSISRRIVEEHGGTLQLLSEPGEGARLRLRLPVRADGEGDASHAS